LIGSLRSFIDNGLYKIRGFMHPVDAMAFSAILEYQVREGMQGGIAEIGVFFGRSFSLLARNAQSAGDRALGIDLFDISGQLDYVRAVIAREGVQQATQLHAGSSLELTARDVTDKIGPVRFFSVDGGHELHHIAKDSELAIETLAPHGVIAFDDFLNPQYPDLTVGVIDFLRHTESVVPFCISRAKLYVCRPEFRDRYMTLIRTTPLWASVEREEFTFLGHRIIFTSQSIINRGLYQKLAERGLGRLGNFLTMQKQRRFAR